LREPLFTAAHADTWSSIGAPAQCATAARSMLERPAMPPP
jgi:hypothetical protein